MFRDDVYPAEGRTFLAGLGCGFAFAVVRVLLITEGQWAVICGAASAASFLLAALATLSISGRNRRYGGALFSLFLMALAGSYLTISVLDLKHGPTQTITGKAEPTISGRAGFGQLHIANYDSPYNDFMGYDVSDHDFHSLKTGETIRLKLYKLTGTVVSITKLK